MPPGRDTDTDTDTVLQLVSKLRMHGALPILPCFLHGMVPKWGTTQRFQLWPFSRKNVMILCSRLLYRCDFPNHCYTSRSGCTKLSYAKQRQHQTQSDDNMIVLKVRSQFEFFFFLVHYKISQMKRTHRIWLETGSRRHKCVKNCYICDFWTNLKWGGGKLFHFRDECWVIWQNGWFK